MTRRTGTLTVVEARQLGGVVTSDAAAAATSLVLDDVSDFDPAGGSALVGDDTLTYTGVDEAASTLLLSEGLAALVEADTPVVDLDVNGAGRVEWFAQVDLEDDEDSDPVTAEIPTALVAYFTEGRDARGMPVEIEATRDGWRVATQPGQEPRFDQAVVRTPSLAASLSEPVSVPSGPLTTLDTMRADTWSTTVVTAWIFTPGGFLVREDGHYLVVVTARWPSDAAGRRAVQPVYTYLEVDDFGPADVRPAASVAGMTTHITDVRFLFGNTVVTSRVLQNSGAALSVSTASLQIVRLGP